MEDSHNPSYVTILDTNKRIRFSVRSYESNLPKKAKSDPKLVYKYLNSKQQVNQPIKALRIGIQTVTNQVEIDYELSKYFQSVFCPDSESSIPHFEPKIVSKSDPNSDDVVNINSLLSKLKSLNPNKAIGPDKVHGRVLKNTADAIITPIALIFRKSFDSGEVPIIWKQANVTPLHKSGSKFHASNYRQVRLISLNH